MRGLPRFEGEEGVAILAYCLVVVSTVDTGKGDGKGYRRVGVAEVRLEWMDDAARVDIELV